MLKLGRSGWRIAGLALVTATILLAAGCGDDGGSSSGGGGTAASSLQGAGATFPEPVYTKMFGS
jgi:ABC-type phosphate transport system substrate-binding protein